MVLFDANVLLKRPGVASHPDGAAIELPGNAVVPDQDVAAVTEVDRTERHPDTRVPVYPDIFNRQAVAVAPARGRSAREVYGRVARRVVKLEIPECEPLTVKRFDGIVAVETVEARRGARILVFKRKVMNGDIVPIKAVDRNRGILVG